MNDLKTFSGTAQGLSKNPLGIIALFIRLLAKVIFKQHWH